MKRSNLVLELRCAVGYGYMAYIEEGAPAEVIKFLENFSIWGGSTKTYENYEVYELPYNTMKFMITDVFKGWLYKNKVELFTEDHVGYRSVLKEIFLVVE